MAARARGGRVHRRIQRRCDPLPLPRQHHRVPMDPDTGSRRLTIAAMESTSTYWKSPFYCLEEVMVVWLLNAAHMKAVPGRKSDVRDAEWIAQLLEHGLLAPSFVPPPEIRRL